MIEQHASLIRLHSSGLVSHSSSLVCSRLSFVFDSSLLFYTGLSFVFTRLHSSLIRLHLSCHSSVILVIRLDQSNVIVSQLKKIQIYSKYSLKIRLITPTIHINPREQRFLTYGAVRFTETAHLGLSQVKLRRREFQGSFRRFHDLIIQKYFTFSVNNFIQKRLTVEEY